MIDNETCLVLALFRQTLNGNNKFNMDSRRGPPETGAPGDSPSELLQQRMLLSSIMDNKCLEISDNWPGNMASTDLGDHAIKTNNRLLFFTVEYVEDQSRDYSRMFPAYRRAPSPLCDFEHRVSPSDPNMSSAARYSPTPVPLTVLPFRNSTSALEGPLSPLVVRPETETDTSTSIDFVAAVTRDDETPTETRDASRFVDDDTEEDLRSAVGQELILMQASELEDSTAPLTLALAGIPSAEFALTRDFLVMHDDDINAANTLGHERESGEETAGVITGETIATDRDNDISLLPVTILAGIENMKSEEKPEIEEKYESDGTGLNFKETERDKDEREGKEDSEKKGRIVRRSKRRRINDKKAARGVGESCENKCAFGAYRKSGGDCCPKHVRTIADEPVPSRAIATLPGSYLSIDKLEDSQIGSSGFGVFAKRNIRSRTQFGPIEGILRPYDGSPFKNSLPLLYETENGQLLKMDVSDENASNWMRFVRPATTCKEQNLGICQQGDGIVFVTTRNILPKEELRAAPNPEYAIGRNLSIFEAQTKDDEETTDDTKRKLERRKTTLSSVPTNKQSKVADRQTRLYGSSHSPKLLQPPRYNIERNLSINAKAPSSPPRFQCRSCGGHLSHPRNRKRRNMMFGESALSYLHGLSRGNNANVIDENIDNVCPECNEDSKRRRSHPITEDVDKRGRSLASHKCNMCYKRFATRVRLQQHYLVHGDEDQKPLPCDICSKRFMNNSALSCHLKTHSEDKQMFECPMCRQRFIQVLMLKEHIEAHRNDDKTLTCPQCPRTFVKYSLIRKHMRAHHCERKHKCQFCAKPFPTVDKLRMHLLRHSDHRQFRCANCEKQFKRKDKLKEHIMRMHNCQRINSDRSSLSNQMKKLMPKAKSTDYNRFVYKCHQCLVGFKRRGMLVNHLAKRHPDVSPESVPELNLPILRQTRDYYCQYCDKVYKSSSKRKAHIVKNHPGAALPPSNRQKESTDASGLPNLTFSQTVGSVTTIAQSCQWCHKQYASKAKLLQHQRKKHSSLMEPADKVPRARNRSNRSSDRARSTDHADGNFVMSDYFEACEIDGDFFKSKIMKSSTTATTEVHLNGNSLQLPGQEKFLRTRDIR